MLLRRSSVRAVAVPVVRPLSPVLLAAAALGVSLLAVRTAHAAPVIDRTLFTWSGRVDREVYITMRGRDVRTSGIDARLPNRTRVDEALPRGRGDVLVRLADGRGNVDIIEQPSARNGFSTTIRIRDPRGGADNYRVIAYWSGDDRFDDRGRNGRDGWEDRDDDRRSNGGWGPGGRRDDDRDRGRDRDRDRDRNDGRWDDRDSRRDRRDDRGLLRWSGRVDDVVEIRISGRRVDAITRSGDRVSNVNANIRGDGLPARGVTVGIDRHAGRGSIRVVQQPSAWNGYTAVIRIDDPSGGASFYDFSAFW